jgi:hypothetical protein
MFVLRKKSENTAELLIEDREAAQTPAPLVVAPIQELKTRAAE